MRNLTYKKIDYHHRHPLFNKNNSDFKVFDVEKSEVIGTIEFSSKVGKFVFFPEHIDYVGDLLTFECETLFEIGRKIEKLNRGVY